MSTARKAMQGDRKGFTARTSGREGTKPSDITSTTHLHTALVAIRNLALIPWHSMTGPDRLSAKLLLTLLDRHIQRSSKAGSKEKKKSPRTTKPNTKR